MVSLSLLFFFVASRTCFISTPEAAQVLSRFSVAILLQTSFCSGFFSLAFPYAVLVVRSIVADVDLVFD